MAIFVGRKNVRVHYSLRWDYLQGLPGGATYDAARDSATIAFHWIRGEIRANHSRSGTLANSMRTDVSKRGTHDVRGLVRSRAAHADWFFYGTAAHRLAGASPALGQRITPKNGKLLHLQDLEGAARGNARLLPSVAGQESNYHLLEKAAGIGATRLRMGRTVTRGVRI